MSFIAHNLSAHFSNFRVFKNISFKLAEKQCLLLQGSNGSGKTTLLNQLSGLNSLQTGSVKYFDSPINQANGEAKIFKQQMIYISHHNYLKENLSVKDNLKLFAIIHGKNTTVNPEAILLRANLSILPEQKVNQLSIGQKKRLLLTQLFFPQKLIWLLDEPLASLDKKSLDWFENILAKHCDSGGMAIISSHQKINYPHQTLNLNQIG